MKKSLLLGSAAALVIAPAAFAADLPVVEPVEYVKVCDAFGAGFHYIPGTETCLKFSGRVRTEFGVQSTDPDHSADNDINDTTFFLSNAELVVNASSMTEVGMLVGQFAISATNNPSGTGNGVSLGDAWITIGENILVGRETSRFDFGAGYGIYDAAYGDVGLNQFTFIMPFGNGFSATLGLEDARNRTAALIMTGPAGTTTATATLQAGMEIPDVVASLRISQGWGSAQVSGALHQLRVVTTATNSESDTDWGFAVEAGIELNVGSMTKVKFKAGYADGALSYVGGGAAADMQVTAGAITDTYTGFDVLGAVTHTIGDLELSLTGQYIDLDDQVEAVYVGATASYEVVENLTVAVSGTYQDYDFDVEGLGATNVDHDDWAAKLRIQRSF